MKSFFLLCCFVPFCCWGQFKVEGVLKDKSNAPIAYCTVKLLQEEKVVEATLSKQDGSFSLQAAAGTYTFTVSSVFYEGFSKVLSLQSDTSLGEISLAEKVQELSGVSIARTKSPITYTDTGVVIAVAESRLKNRDNILEILDYAPSISTVNGLNILGSDDIQLVLDGKELHLPKDKILKFLSTIPTNTIESIEVVDRMDASTEASKFGIIKINTIQKQGWVGELRQRIYFKPQFGYDSGVDLFYATEKYRIYGNLYHFRSKTVLEEANELTLKNVERSYNSTTEAKLRRIGDNVLFGTDYTPHENTSLSFLYMLNYDEDKDHDRNTRTEVYDHNTYDHWIANHKLFSQRSTDHTFSLALKQTLDTLNSNLQVNLDFMNRKYENPSWEEETLHKALVTTKVFEEANDDKVFVYALKAAWNKKWADKQAFSLGTRLSLVDNRLYQNRFYLVNQQYIKDTDYSKDFFLKEYILALYASYNFPVGESASVSLGARSEYNYNDFNNRSAYYYNDDWQWLFNAQYKGQLWGYSFYISAAERLSRPYFNAFNPTYIRYSPTTAGVGNKELKPANTYQVQWGHTGRLNLSLTYRYTQNNIVYMPSDVAGIRVTRPENAGYKNDFFLHISSFQKLTDWCEMNAKFVGGSLHFKLPNEQYHSLYAEVFLSQRFYLPWDMELGVNYTYTSDHKNMYFKNYQSNTFGVDLFYPISDAFKLNAFVSDLFNTSRSKSEYDFNQVYSYSYNKANTRFFGLSLIYQFAKGKEVEEDVRGSGIEGERSRL